MALSTPTAWCEAEEEEGADSVSAFSAFLAIVPEEEEELKDKESATGAWRQNWSQMPYAEVAIFNEKLQSGKLSPVNLMTENLNSLAIFRRGYGKGMIQLLCLWC